MTDQSAPPPFPADAVGSTESPGRVVSEGQARMFPCDSCGADLEFHIGQQQMKCPFCGFEKAIELAEDAEIQERDFEEALRKLADQRSESNKQLPESKEVRCDSCGGNVVFTGTLTSSECPYCATPIQLANVHDAEDRIPVDAVLTFQISKDEAGVNLAAWVKSRWFAPNEFKKKGAQGKFTGVYLPYWTFDSMTFTIYQGERGEYYWVEVGTGDNKRRERRTRWYPASGRFQRFFDDVLVIATAGMKKKLVLKLEPWPLGRCLPFTQEALAGHLARTYDTQLPDGFREAKGRIENAIEYEVRQRIGGDTQRVHHIGTDYSAITYKHVLLPTYLLAYRFREKVYQVMVNAATGEVQGERPWSWVKITLAVLAGLALIIGILFLVNR